MLSPATDTNRETARGLNLPFSEGVGEAELYARARRLVEALGLSSDVRLVKGGGAAGLRGERGFRLSWWSDGEEPLRGALQSLKAGVLRRASGARERARLTEAWRRAELRVNSDAWRLHLRRLAEGCAPRERVYLRLAFRAAQQAWSRAARWDSLAPDGAASPFGALLDLFAAGAWPLGCRDGSLRVFVWERGAEDFGPTEGGVAEFAPTFAPQRETRRDDFVFLSAPFSAAALTARWEKAMRAGGLQTVHGPVEEFVSSPEVQLGARIRRARAVVGLSAAPDPDFGLPWWMFQELDYARACGRPVFLACRGKSLEEGRRLLREVYNAPTEEGGADDTELRLWLKANAPRLWRDA